MVDFQTRSSFWILHPFKDRLAWYWSQDRCLLWNVGGMVWAKCFAIATCVAISWKNVHNICCCAKISTVFYSSSRKVLNIYPVVDWLEMLEFQIVSTLYIYSQERQVKKIHHPWLLKNSYPNITCFHTSPVRPRVFVSLADSVHHLKKIAKPRLRRRIAQTPAFIRGD